MNENLIHIEDWTDIAPTAIRLPIKLYQNKTLIDYWWKKGLLKFNLGETNILVLGRPNVGKSVLLSHLQDSYSNTDWKPPVVSNKVESIVLRLGESANILRCLPGQKYSTRFEGLKNGFNSKNLRGIIYVTDFGFTDYRDPTIKQQMGSKFKNLKQLINHNLREELNDYRIICDRIAEAKSNGSEIKWMLIVTNKSDLFFSDLSSAQTYYHTSGNSEFSRISNTLLETVGRTNFELESIPICSFEEDFVWNSETVTTSIGGTMNKKNLYNYFIGKLYQHLND